MYSHNQLHQIQKNREQEIKIILKPKQRRRKGRKKKTWKIAQKQRDQNDK